MHDLIIIGGGPAALSAAIYVLGKQLDLLMVYVDRGGRTGWHQRLTGQLADEELAGENAVRSLEQQVMQSGHTVQDRVRRVSKPATVFRVETEQHDTLESLAVIVATGARPILLDVPGAQELLGQGLGYSITTHAHLLAGKTVAIIGTTERALRGVAELVPSAAQVYLIAHDATGLSAPIAQAFHQRPNVKILEGYNVKEITGAFNVEEVVVARGAETQRLSADAAFVDLGLYANSDFVRNIVQTDEYGFIKVNDRNATVVPGLFAAGDVTNVAVEQKLIAIGEGAKAAVSAYDYLLWRRWARTR